METKEMQAEISKKIRKGILIAFIVYEAVIFLLGILGFIVGHDYRNVDNYKFSWWYILEYRYYWISQGIDRYGYPYLIYHNESNPENIVFALLIIIVLMLPPVIAILINIRRRKLVSLTANEKEIVGSYTAFIPISKIALKMPIDKVDNITVVDSKLHWYTGKTIRISSTSGVIKIPYVLNADEIVAFISEAIEKTKESQKQAQPVPLPQTDATDSLKKLAELRDAGIITEEEFNQKKNELLGKI